MLLRDELEVNLKEWQLCQDNLKRHNDWLWQTGSIFVVVSLAAFWALASIGSPENKQWFWIFSGFSIATIFIWYVFIVRRVNLWFDTTTKQLFLVEKEIRGIVGIERELLHTMQRGKTQHSLLKSRYAPYSIMALIIVAWISTWFLLFGQDFISNLLNFLQFVGLV
jgi:hypothetical protein